MAPRVGKIHFSVADTFRLNGVKVVRVTWPIDQPVHDDTPLRAYGPRGYIGVVRPQAAPTLHNKLIDFGYLRPGTSPGPDTVVDAR